MVSKADSKDAGNTSKKMADSMYGHVMSGNDSNASQADMDDDLLLLNWEMTFSGMLSDIVQVFDAYHHVNETVESFTFSMISGRDPEELERQVQILSDLLRKLSARVNILCENNIRSIESQLEIAKVNCICKKNEEDDDCGLGFL